ncbi:MAG: hypothetical protein KZQ66_10620 [Candidatus Thiodiazotropha sp. (ex Lucinoma aequizonata)]|nr:hypothetical protein [Candidatus Thiodiazotropha sp. (ex Lucinoma aequizonata)]
MVHLIGIWLALLVLSLEMPYLLPSLADHYNAWRWLGWAVVPSGYLLLVSFVSRLPWPVSTYYAGVPCSCCSACGGFNGVVDLVGSHTEQRRRSAAALPAANQSAGDQYDTGTIFDLSLVASVFQGATRPTGNSWISTRDVRWDDPVSDSYYGSVQGCTPLSRYFVSSHADVECHRGTSGLVAAVDLDSTSVDDRRR